MPPKFQACYICGREFGSQSLAIHQKQCLQKREKEQANLPPNLRTTLTYDPTSGENASDAWKKSLAPCPNCGRTFLPDRLEVHARSCKAERAAQAPPSSSYTNPSMGRPPSASSATTYFPAKPQQQQQQYAMDNGYGAPAKGRVQNGSGYNIITGASQQQTYQDFGGAGSRAKQPQTQQPGRPQFQQAVEQPPTNRVAKPPAGGRGGRGAPFQVNVGPLAPCRVCGRSFAEDRIAKHESICQASSHKRKVFDSSKARKKGTELEGFRNKGGGASRAPPAKAKGFKGQSKWRAEHEEFIRNVRAARQITHIQKVGGAAALANLPPPPPSLNLDYIECPHCHRRFNETAGERHIPKCKDTIHKPKPPPVRAAIPQRTQATPTRAPAQAPKRMTATPSADAYSGFDSFAYPPQRAPQQSAAPYSSNGYSVRQPTPTRTNNAPTTTIRNPTPTRTTSNASSNIRQPTPTRTTTRSTSTPRGSVASTPRGSAASSTTQTTATKRDSIYGAQQQQPTLVRKNSYGNLDSYSTQTSTATKRDSMYGTLQQQQPTIARKNSFGNLDIYGVQQQTTTAAMRGAAPTSARGASAVAGLPPSGRPSGRNSGAGMAFAGGYGAGSGSDDTSAYGYSNIYSAQQTASTTAPTRGGAGISTSLRSGPTTSAPTKPAVGAPRAGAVGSTVSRAPRFCGNCGTSFNTTAKFCMECGGPRM